MGETLKEIEREERRCTFGWHSFALLLQLQLGSIRAFFVLAFSITKLIRSICASMFEFNSTNSFSFVHWKQRFWFLNESSYGKMFNTLTTDERKRIFSQTEEGDFFPKTIQCGNRIAFYTMCSLFMIFILHSISKLEVISMFWIPFQHKIRNLFLFAFAVAWFS